MPLRAPCEAGAEGCSTSSARIAGPIQSHQSWTIWIIQSNSSPFYFHEERCYIPTNDKVEYGFGRERQRQVGQYQVHRNNSGMTNLCSELRQDCWSRSQHRWSFGQFRMSARRSNIRKTELHNNFDDSNELRHHQQKSSFRLRPASQTELACSWLSAFLIKDSG